MDSKEIHGNNGQIGYSEWDKLAEVPFDPFAEADAKATEAGETGETVKPETEAALGSAAVEAAEWPTYDDWDDIDWGQDGFDGGFGFGEPTPVVEAPKAVEVEKPMIDNPFVLDAERMTYSGESFDREVKNQIRYGYLGEEYSGVKITDQMVEIYQQLGTNNHNAVSSIVTASQERLDMMSDTLTAFAGCYDSLPKEIRQTRGVNDGFQELALEVIRNFDEDVFNEDTIPVILSKIEGEFSGKEFISRTKNDITYGIIAASVSHDFEAFNRYYGFAKEIGANPENAKLVEGRSVTTYDYPKKNMLTSYVIHHGLTEDEVRGFKENVFPMLDTHDPEVEILQTANNSWGTVPGEYGISDYVIKCLASKRNPRNIRDMMQLYREIPTSDYARFEQNRNDAAILQGILWSGRDFIHDECRGIHEVLAAMVNFYDTKDDPEAHAHAETQLRELAENRLDPANNYHYAGFDGERCFDLENYERQVVGDRKCGSRIETTYDEPAIEILRRLAKNTEQVTLDKPQTEDEELNGMLERFHPRMNERTGEVVVNWKQTGELVAYMNKMLQETKGQIGMRPSMVQALSYVERMATYAMRGVDRHDYRDLSFDPNFKEMVRFNELTVSADSFNEEEFKLFWGKFQREAGQNWRDETNDHYRLLNMRVTNRITKLAAQYKREGAPEYMIGSLWSGNLCDELTGLVIEK